MKTIPLTDVHFVTSNKNKLSEVRAILGEVRSLELDLEEIQELDLEQITIDKMKRAREHSGEILLVEDTALAVLEMGRLPGPYVKWFLKELGTPGLSALLRKLDNTTAVARTVFCLSVPGEELVTGLGEVKGKIVQPRGEGFGWDPIFEVAETGMTYAEMDDKSKNEISHRACSLRALQQQMEAAGVRFK